MTALFVVLTACPPDHADRLADALIAGQHAACVTALPGARSTYRWQGAVQHEVETLLLVKVVAAQLDACLAALETLHPYEVPELVVLPAERVNAAYLAWASSGLPDTAQA